MMVTQKSYARALQLEAPGKLRVLEQFSGRGAQADLLGAAALDLDEDPEKEVLLFDKGDSSIGILDRTPQGTYGLVRSIQLPGIEFGGFRIADLDGDGREDVAVLGKQAIAILSSKGGGGDLEEIARFDRQEEPSGQERILAEGICMGDLNADGRMDLVVSTGPHNLLEFLTPEPGKTGGPLRSQLSFPVFEERSFHREMPVPGPREILASDIDGDGKTDLVLLIHNRILFYPQD